MKFLEAANGLPMLILCAIIIVVVLFQPTILSITARKRGYKLGMTKKELNTVVKSSAIFAILPSIPILASYLVLVPAQGKYFPWLRLSVVGSVMYETTVATQAAQSFGYDNIYNVDFPLEVFFPILLILTVGILGGNFFNLFFLKSYDKGVKKLMGKNAAMVPIITGAIFIAMFSIFGTPQIANIKRPIATIVFIISGITAVILERLGKNSPKLAEFAFSISLLVGMLAACLINPLLPQM